MAERFAPAARLEVSIRVPVQGDALERVEAFVEQLRAAGIPVELSGTPSAQVLAQLGQLRAALERRLASNPDDTEAADLLNRVAQDEAMQRFIARFCEPNS